jgi:hypothetical protein
MSYFVLANDVYGYGESNNYLALGYSLVCGGGY